MKSSKLYFPLLSNRSFLVVAGFAALITAASIYLVFIFYSLNGLYRQVDTQLLKTSDALSTQIKLKFEKNSTEIKYISLNNALMYLLELDLDAQLKDICNNIVDESNTDVSTPSYGEVKILTVLKDDGRIVFTNSSLFKGSDKKPVSLTDKYYEKYISGDSIYYLIYYPITKINPITKKQYFIGAVISTCDIVDMAELIQKSLANTSIGADFELRGYTSGNLRFVITPNSVSREPKSLQGLSVPALQKLIPLTGDTGKVKLSLCLTHAEYSKIKATYIKNASVAATGTTILVFAAFAVMIFVLRLGMTKSIKTRLSVENLRVQKHEFVKHISIVDGLIKLNQIEMLRNYIQSINDNLIYFEGAGKIDNPAVHVLIGKKEEECRNKGILFTMRTNISLKDTFISGYDLCTILGNLVDNAIEAASVYTGEKKVDLELGWQADVYIFTVTNTGKEIKSHGIKRIFRHGYTTKGRGKGRGIGLYLVRKIVKRYAGTIEVSSKEGVTSFTVYIPENKEA